MINLIGIKKIPLVIFLLFFISNITLAAPATADVTIINTVNTALQAAAGNGIMTQAIMWLSSFMAIQFVLTNISIIKNSSDIDIIFAKLLGSILWFTFCFYVMTEGQNFIDSVGTGMLSKFAPNVPSPSSIIKATLAICAVLLGMIVTTGTSVLGTGNSAIANMLVSITFLIFGIGMFMAIKIMMLTLELALIVLLAPLSFSFLGLNALKDQGIAPFKALISLVYRVIVLGVIFAAFSEITSVSGKILADIQWANPREWGKGIDAIFVVLSAFPIIGYLTYKSDSIAASLASGSTNMGTGDVAAAAAAGAAAATAAGSVGAGAASTASKAPQAMGDVLKALGGSGASALNASSRGAGAGSGQAPLRSAASGGATGSPQASSGVPKRDGGSAVTNQGPAAGKAGTQGAVFGDGSKGGADASNSGRAGATTSTNALGSAGGTSRAETGNGTDNGTKNSQASAPAPAAHGSALGPEISGESAAMAGESAAMADASSSADETSSDSSLNAGSVGSTEYKIDQMLDALAQQAAPKKASLVDNLASTNKHIAQETTATHINISTQHSD